MSSSSVANSPAQPSAKSLQQPILPMDILCEVFDRVQALDNLDDMLWLWMDARRISVAVKFLIESLFRLKYLPLVQIRVLANTGISDPDSLQPGGISELHTFHFFGLSKSCKVAAFVLRPDHDPRVMSEIETSCFDHGDTIRRLTLGRVHRSYACLCLGLEIEIGEMVFNYKPPYLAFGKCLGSLSILFPWSNLLTMLLRKETNAMAFSSRSQALEPSDTDDDLAPDPRPVDNPATPTKPSPRENQTSANAPKKNPRLTRKFSETDLEEYTPSKRPRLVDRPSIATRRPENAGIKKVHPLPIRLRQAHPGNQQNPSMTMQMKGDSRSRPYNRSNAQDSIEARMEQMKITSSLASENESMYTNNSQNIIEAMMDHMENETSLPSEDEDMYTYNSQDSSEAETDRMETSPSPGSEDEDVFGDDEISS